MVAGCIVTRRDACLALLTDAYGGRGGIAQYNRDLTAALAGVPSLAAIEILPRIAPDATGALPAKVPPTSRHGSAVLPMCSLRRLAAGRPPQTGCHILRPSVHGPARAVAGQAVRGAPDCAGPWHRSLVPAVALLRLSVERADLVLAVSRDTRARVLDWANIEPERVRVASNTVADEFTPGEASTAPRGPGLGQRVRDPDRRQVGELRALQGSRPRDTAA